MLGHALLTAFERFGDRAAFLCEGGTTSYATLGRWSLAMASLFKNRLGWKRGDCVAVQLPNIAPYASILTALALDGAAILPISQSCKPGEVARNLNGMPLAGIVSLQATLAGWDACPQLSSVPRVALEPLMEDLGSVHSTSLQGGESALEQDAGLCLMTSGTTGAPKLVVRSQAGLLANAANLRKILRLQPGCVLLPVTPFSHANGFSNGMLLPLLSGACLVTTSQFFPAHLVNLIKEHKVEVLLASPVVYAALLRHEATPADVKSLRCCISSGAPLPTEVARSYRTRLGVSIQQLYGSSETGTIAMVSPDDDLEGTVGAPLPGVEVAIRSEHGRDLPRGETGQVAVRSKALMKGYWDAQGILPCRTEDGYYLTGDLGQLCADGKLKLTGRIRRVINVGGNKVSPDEIEQVLAAMPGVLRYRVTACQHPFLIQSIEATVHALSGSGVTRSSIVEYCREHLTEYKIPRHFHVEYREPSDLPEKWTPSG